MGCLCAPPVALFLLLLLLSCGGGGWCCWQCIKAAPQPHTLHILLADERAFFLAAIVAVVCSSLMVVDVLAF